MTGRPSLANLRARVFKHSGTDRPEVGNWLARRVGRPSAVYGTWAAARLGVSAHAVTLAALVASLGGAALIGTGLRWGFVSGVVVLAIAYWLDHVDGQVARWRGTASLSGVYFDYLLHHAASASLGFALGFGIALRTGSPIWSIAGFATAFGWAGLSLHNDCRYKAFFQRLKATDRGYAVRPSRLAAPSRSAVRSASWLAAKVCEPHVVLVGLVGLAVVAIVTPSLWSSILRYAVGSMAILAPTLATTRVAKAIRGGATDSEFAAWFQPLSDGV